MKLRFMLVSLFFGFSVYSLLNLFWGPCGLERMYGLASYRAQVKEDIRKLEAASGRLQAQIKLLAMNKDYINSQAMELGYLGTDQGFIFLNGYSPDQKESIDIILTQNNAVDDSPQNLLRGIGLSVSAIIMLLFYFLSLSEKKEQSVQNAN